MQWQRENMNFSSNLKSFDLYVLTLIGGDEMLLHVLCSALLGRLTYLTSRCQYEDVSVEGRIPWPSLSALEG